MYRFEHESKKIKLIPLGPIAKQPKPNALKKLKGVHLIDATKLHHELNGGPFMILAAREVVKIQDNPIPPEVTPEIEFNGV